MQSFPERNPLRGAVEIKPPSLSVLWPCSGVWTKARKNKFFSLTLILIGTLKNKSIDLFYWKQLNISEFQKN
jgi:hypothetical protein